MPQRKSQPIKWSPKGLSDTLDTSEIFDGAMTLLQNLVPDPSTVNVWQCRPAAVKLTDFGRSGIMQLSILAGGAGYTNGTYTNVPLLTTSNFPGSGATANITVAGNTVTVANIVVPGTGYDGHNLTVAAASIGGTGSGLLLAPNVGLGGISTFSLVGGAGYTNGTYNNVSLTGGTYVQIEATAQIIVTGGAVTTVNIQTPGQGYLVGDVLTAPASAIGGTGAGFSLTNTSASGMNLGSISALLVIGNIAYGMIGSTTGATSGKDVPFSYNLLTNTFNPISNVLATNLPTSQSAWSPPATPSAWMPPAIALVGSQLIFTHVGFSGTGTNWIGILNVSSVSTPAWSTTNLTGAIQFTVVPTWVQNFNGRAYYIHNALSQPAVIFSDVLVPTNCTNGNQVLTFNDNVPLTAMGPLQLNNQLGGIVQSLMVFKGVANIFQITGDAALNSLNLNTLNVATGTLAPNTISATPKGLAFMAPDGYRIIDFQANISDPVGLNGSGVTLPFINAIVPSRCSSSCNGTLIRMTLQNGIKPGTPVEEYWFQFGGSWTGPQLFPITAAQFSAPSLSSEFANSFIVAYASGGTNVAASLWRSDYYQTTLSTFVENGNQMQWVWQTPELPSAEQMGNISVTESTLMCAFGVGNVAYGVSALSPSGTGITGTQITSQAGATIWGAFSWGGAVWGSSIVTLADHQIAWPIPIVSTRVSFQVNGSSAQNVKIGTMRVRYQPLSQFLSPAAGVQ